MPEFGCLNRYTSLPNGLNTSLLSNKKLRRERLMGDQAIVVYIWFVRISALWKYFFLCQELQTFFPVRSYRLFSQDYNYVLPNNILAQNIQAVWWDQQVCKNWYSIFVSFLHRLLPFCLCNICCWVLVMSAICPRISKFTNVINRNFS